MKRGEFILYFTSRESKDGKRKVDNFWYKLNEAPEVLIKVLKEKIIEEFSSDRINLYDLIAVFEELKTNNYLTTDDITKILRSDKIKSLPITIVPYLNIEEILLLKEILNINDLKDSLVKPFWYEDIAKL